MTARKHLKHRVRARMQRTGESYTTARRIVLAARPDPDVGGAADQATSFAGSTPEATTLRVLLTTAGAVAPHTGRPWTEAMLLGLTGGVGIAVHAFHYERADVSTLFVAARRPDLPDAMVAGLDRLGVAHEVHETGGARAAEARLRADLDAHGATAAWVDAATLGTRGMPDWWEGGGYHVVAVLALDDTAGTATLADLADGPVVVDQTTLAAARARIRKQRHRLLALTSPPGEDLDLGGAVTDAVDACHGALVGDGPRAVGVTALDDLARRIDGDRGRDSWARVFPRGRHLWTALTSLHHFVEHYGTGGGLSRPLYADFLREAAAAVPRLRGLERAAERYDELGRQWTQLANAALPDDLDLTARARALQDERAALYAEAGADAAPRVAEVWRRLDDLADEAQRAFPLDAERTAALCAELARRVRALADGERDAAARLATTTAA